MRTTLAARYQRIRDETERRAAPLSPEDQGLQSMADASPAKWHRAHTGWFFETFVLTPHLPGYRAYDDRFTFLYNSYYQQVGPQHARPQRGMLSRPSAAEIGAYRAHVDRAMATLIATGDGACFDLIELGLNHEQQHQELLLTDIKHAFAQNPLAPVYAPPPARASFAVEEIRWLPIPGGIHRIGHDGGGFGFDNEGPAHDVLLQPFAIADRPIANASYLAFIADGGYARPELWLSDGWQMVVDLGLQAPLYWQPDGTGWRRFSLHGDVPLSLDAPLSHISYYEADAFARWAGRRLPTEAEWESALRHLGARLPGSETAEPGFSTDPDSGIIFGGVWEWTGSAYAAYPRYRPADGAVGEYNAKFMCNQMVLRGRSCATPAEHSRLSYRNFFAPAARWQFTGLRLADDR